MDIRKLQRAIVDGLEDVKAQDIVVFNTEHLSPLFERVIIASGTSNRQTKALASSVRDKVRGQGGTVLATEGADNGEWIIVDCGAAVAHILQPALRHYYHLEELWGGKPVNMKLATVARGLVKASEPEPDGEDDEAPAPAAPKAPARRPAAAKKSTSSAGKTAAAAKPVKKVAKKAAKTAGRATVTHVVPPPRAAKKAAKQAAKKAATRRAAAPAAAKKAPARKAAGKKTVTRTPARSAAPARKGASKPAR
jgi:ribosome-associated protein